MRATPSITAYVDGPFLVRGPVDIYDEDGTAVSGTSGGIASDGDVIELQADDSLRIRVGNAGAVRINVNGIGLGTMGGNGAVVEWRIERSDG